MEVSTTVTIDGQLVAARDATISIFDRGFLYGDGCFEVLRTWNGVARDLEPHLERLLDTAAYLQLHPPPRAQLGEYVYRTLAAAGQGEARIRVVLTRGPGALTARLGALGPGKSIVVVEALPELVDEISMAVVDWPLARRSGRGHKTLAYLDHLLARELARAAGADEALRLDADGHCVEGATCNVFAVLAGAVATPPVDRGALPGIVRGRVLGLCAREQLRVQVRALTLREVRAADELFITSSLRGVVAVTALDGALRASGPITRHLASAYATAMRSPVL